MAVKSDPAKRKFPRYEIKFPSYILIVKIHFSLRVLCLKFIPMTNMIKTYGQINDISLGKLIPNKIY